MPRAAIRFGELLTAQLQDELPYAQLKQLLHALRSRHPRYPRRTHRPDATRPLPSLSQTQLVERPVGAEDGGVLENPLSPVQLSAATSLVATPSLQGGCGSVKAVETAEVAQVVREPEGVVDGADVRCEVLEDGVSDASRQTLVKNSSGRACGKRTGSQHIDEQFPLTQTSPHGNGVVAPKHCDDRDSQSPMSCIVSGATRSRKRARVTNIPSAFQAGHAINSILQRMAECEENSESVKWSDLREKLVQVSEVYSDFCSAMDKLFDRTDPLAAFATSEFSQSRKQCVFYSNLFWEGAWKDYWCETKLNPRQVRFDTKFCALEYAQ